MKLSGLTRVSSASSERRRRSSRRAVYSPTYPPPTMSTLAANAPPDLWSRPDSEATRGTDPSALGTGARLRGVRAARFVGPGRPIEVEDVPDPIAGPFDVVVRVEACGICASDLHFIHGEMPLPVPAPVTDRKSTRLNSSHGYISSAVF